MMTSDTESTDSTVNSTSDPHPTFEARRNGVINIGTAVVLLSAGGVAVIFSARGAQAIFTDSWIVPIVFAASAQIIVSMALWALPRATLTRCILLMCAWLAGVSVSIGSAYLATYENSANEIVSELRDSTIRSFGKIKQNIEEVKQASIDAAKMTDDETQRGTYSGRGPNFGPHARILAQQALTASTKADAAKTAEEIVDAAMESLKRPGLRTEDVRTIYFDTIGRVGNFTNDLQEPDFRVDRNSPLVIVGSAISIVTGKDAAASPTERTRVHSSLATASIMELLALLCSLLRVEMYRGTRRPRGGSSPGTVVVEAIFSIVHIPERLRDLNLLSRLRAREKAAQRMQRLNKSDSDFISLTQGETPDDVWIDVVKAQAAATGTKNYGKVVTNILTSELGTRRSHALSQRMLKGKPILFHGMLSTEVLVEGPGERLLPGPRWDAWIRFLIRASADPQAVFNPPPRSRGTGRPKLKVVGGKESP